MATKEEFNRWNIGLSTFSPSTTNTFFCKTIMCKIDYLKCGLIFIESYKNYNRVAWRISDLVGMKIRNKKYVFQWAIEFVPTLENLTNMSPTTSSHPIPLLSNHIRYLVETFFKPCRRKQHCSLYHLKLVSWFMSSQVFIICYVISNVDSIMHNEWPSNAK